MEDKEGRDKEGINPKGVKGKRDHQWGERAGGQAAQASDVFQL